MNPRKMKAISEAYQKILALEVDVKSITDMADKILDNKGNAWISIDLEDDLINEMQTTGWTTTTASDAFFMSTETKQNVEDNGLSMDVPDTVALEILGVILRYKQQLLNNSENEY